MKKQITKQELYDLILDSMVSVWTAICDRLDIEESLDEMEFMPLWATGAEDKFSYLVESALDANGYIEGGERFKAQAFDTGGGWWICGKYLDLYTYVVISNEDEDFCLSYYDLREDEKEGYTINDGLFPCMGFLRSTPLEEMTRSEIVLWKELKNTLEEAM